MKTTELGLGKVEGLNLSLCLGLPRVTEATTPTLLGPHCCPASGNFSYLGSTVTGSCQDSSPAMLSYQLSSMQLSMLRRTAPLLPQAAQASALHAYLDIRALRGRREGGPTIHGNAHIRLLQGGRIVDSVAPAAHSAGISRRPPCRAVILSSAPQLPLLISRSLRPFAGKLWTIHADSQTVVKQR